MKKLILVTIIISTIFCTGCWDMIEINNRIYPYTVGYDLIDSEDGRFKIIFSYPNLAAMGKNPSSDIKTFIISTNANNLFEAIHKLTPTISNPIYLKHLKVVLLSDEVASNDHMVREIVDGLSRDFIVNKNSQMLVLQGSPNQLLTSVDKYKRQESVEGVLYSLLLNQQQSSMFTPITLSNFIENMDLSHTAIAPLIHIDKDELYISGGAIFKDYKLIGYLTHEENRAIAYLNNQVDNDGIEVQYNGAGLSSMITNIDSKKKLVSKETNIRIKYNVELEGHLHSYIIGDSIETNEKLQDMQNHVAKVIKADLEKGIEKVQKDLKVDALFIADYLSKFHPNLWDEIKDNWEEIYPEIEFEVDVEVFIRRRGLTK